MPELPDLQVFSRNLTKYLKGKKVDKIICHSKKLNVPVKDLQDTLEKAELTKVERVGKELHFIFNNKHILGLHLMLHGQLTLSKEEEKKNLVFALKFNDGWVLSLNDLQAAAVPTLDPKENNTPDALDVTESYLREKLSKTRTPVKTVLMDQKVVRGIGNAYADEILWGARLSPFSASNKIPAEKIKELTQSIIKVLENAEKQILKEHPDNISGEYRDFMEVHNVRKKRTSTDSVILQKPIASRKTYYTEEQQEY
ncbi:MAG TPA: DNA-formamidopyrimidine glycosylase family protein [Mucilaginibacter sp.]|jgi:formamidopyrimidine-DNA glycosylase|nr:DNA-formamidopyrimidine glycosylase family protein [Mucilaginibacter sp.]